MKKLLKPLYLRMDALIDRSSVAHYLNLLYQKYALRDYKGTEDIDCIHAPIFIVGAPHSGTSIMLAILGNHSRIYAVPKESSLFFRPIRIKLLLIRRWNLELVRREKKRWVEKTPEHIFKLDAIFRYYPAARVLIMLRDGRDVACSVQARTGDFLTGINWWLEYNEAADSYLRDPRVLLVKYEALVRRTNNTLSRIFDFIGESFEPGVKNTQDKRRKWYSQELSEPKERSGEFHNQYRNWQLNQPLFDGSGKWLEEFSEADSALFKKLTGRKLIEYGYERNSDW